MDRLHSMRIFASVVDEGSFAGAARRLHVSPAVVTRMVADLEQHLGARLMNRTTRSQTLTDTGRLYLERVREILAQVDEAEAVASDATGAPRGPLRVLAPAAFAMHRLAAQLPRFKARFPQVQLDLTVTGPVESVDEQHDVSILAVLGELQQGDFVARRLASYEIVMCASAAYLAQHGAPVHPSNLDRHEVMLPRPLRELTFHRRDDPATSVSVPVARPTVNTVHIGTLRAAALAGAGIASLPSFMVDEALADGRLRRVLPDWRLLSATLYAAVPTRKHLPAKTRAFIDFLVETFAMPAINLQHRLRESVRSPVAAN
jgi:DNA-binding transcriptional LysR family regulator